MKTLVSQVGRRQVLALGAVTVFGKVLAACASKPANDATTSPTTEAGTPAETGAVTDADTAVNAEAAVTPDAAASGGWATGGTAAMTGKASYPDPFAGNDPTTCAVTCSLTEGPCWSAQAEEIEDITYGKSGLPMRMLLRVLDADCKPVADATVDVWHTGPIGIYSGNDSAHENVAFCTGNDSDYSAHVYFRGKQKTDAKGVAAFDTLFPGWYASRTIHIHMTISIGGQDYVTTQLGFADTLSDEIIDTQPIYKDRGKRDTTNKTDGIVKASAGDRYLFETQKMPDGALLASKTFIVRKSLNDAICAG